MNKPDYHHTLLRLLSERRPCVSVTLVDTKGSAPQDIGARAIFSKDDLLFGTVGGGKIENYCHEFSKELLSADDLEDTHIFKTWNLQKDIGMTCGGVVSLFFEVYSPGHDWNITIFGAGHVSQELCRSLIRLDCNINCIDSRREWLDKLPDDYKLKKICHANPKDCLDELDKKSFLIFMTKGHATDLPILERALAEFNFPYLGVIGSNAKLMVLRKELLENGLSAARSEQFICPIGEPIGNNQPAEIALSIIAQLLKIRDEVFQTAKRRS
jgi:xanthine dehydrogenase accessory factor